ncbi:protein ELYS homolog [Sitodiplosis mosellana]|uniref:protein ELYS homolog n=1 Tax=Sitodiplosis mosellana TaxID=263140 RepID=UPI002444F93A|nr:protein ELYS homolog [Sitodiplosis mosellana]XP_055317185.1 protein ELYS homolog [Sitodiplosis mosellana]
MRPESLELESKSRISVSQTILQKLKSSSPNASGIASICNEEEFLGGVIRGGQLAWIAVGSNVEVLSTRTGHRVAGHSFDEKSIVTCVAEVTANDISSCLLIIAVQRVPIGGLLYLFSVQGSRIVHCIGVVDKITSCCFISDAACKRGCLKTFNGCAAVGTDAGEVFLVDLNLNRCRETISRQKPFNPNSDDTSCKLLSAPIDEDEVRVHIKQTRLENINLGIRLDFSVVEQPSPISSILSMPQMQMIVIGLENGLLALFNLCDLNALHLAYPPEIDSPLLKMTFLEPADDPRPCVYIWAFHANKNNFPFAVMHSVSFTSKTYQDGENIYETFQWCRPDLTIPIHERESTPISCQSVTKIVSDEEDEQYSLCLLAWTNRMSSFVLVFDLNQWYKEQMPRMCDWRDYPSYLAPFPVEIGDAPLDIWLNPKSVVTFNSIQRPEEHFYPTSLSFDLIELKTTIVHKLQWAGLQNNAIKKLSSTGAVAILMPDECFVEFLEASLIPQLSDQNYHANPSKRLKQEFLLSMALEYNCMSLLRECAQHWADGSHMGRGVNDDGLTLSTLTDWIWHQATLIKDRCNDLCVPLFDDSGITIDLRSRKILAHYSRQLKLLADLLHMIITNYRQYIPDEIFDTLTMQRNSIRMTSEYQEVLQWLLNMGLLPEIVWNQLSLPEARNNTFTAIPYPYRILNKFYTEQRQRFYDIDRSNITPKTNSCKCLYIDSFIDRECNSHLLRNEWNNGLGDGLYPPPSLQAMLRILLIPGITLENKYMLFVYLFLDLHMVLEAEHFNVVQNLIKFPAVFNLNSSLIKTTQAFWNLDHNEYEIALKELISPLTSDRLISQWQQELLVNTLLIRDMPNLALQAIRAPGPSINTPLRIKTLLANNLITEAFELQRSKFDEHLLLEFFKGCHEHKKWNYVLGLSLTEREGEILCKFLKTCDSLLSENLQLLYLLQRNRYIEALTYLDDLKHKPRSIAMHKKLENTQDMIISSYKLAMNTTNRALCDQYMAIKDRLRVDVQQNNESTSPLSSHLNPYIVDTNANVVGSVFHRAIVSAKRTGFNSMSQKYHIPLLGNIRVDLDLEEVDDYKPTVEPKPYIGLLKRRKEISYENNADPDQRQPAAKRQRTDSFSIADQPLKKHAPGINSYLMTSLTNQNQMVKKAVNRLDLDDTIEIDNDQRNSLGELCDTVNLLSTPVVKSSRLDIHSRIESRCQTPQSILKQRHTEAGSIISRRSTSPSLTVHSARRSVDFNAQPFCYTIPSQNDEYRLGAIEETGHIEEDDDSSSLNSPNSIKGRRAIHSGKSSTASNSIDEFYSPETSKVQEEHEKSIQVAENNELSRISHQNDAPAASNSNIKSRRGLRSKTPEIPMMSSTRITRSRSKLNLDDSVDYETATSQPVLNTSTPKRATPKRSSSRSLSKNVITSNALKAQSEAEKLVKDKEPEYVYSTDDSPYATISEAKQRNYLKDASEMSVKQASMAYSTDELDATQFKHKHNLLQDSSSFASERSESDAFEKLSEHEDSIKEQIDEEIVEQVEQNVQESEYTEDKPIDDQSTVDYSMESIGNEPNLEQVQENIEIASDTPTSTQNSPIPTIVVTETVSEQTEITTRTFPQNYLVDSSMGASESIMQKINRYEHYTSSFGETTPAKNFLEDSSICTQQTAAESASYVDSEKDVVNLDDFHDDESKSESSSNNTISSEDSSDTEIQGDLVYEESDNEENDEVIQISSSSDDDDDDDESHKSSDDVQITDSHSYNEYDDLKYDINDEFATTSQPQSTEYEHVDDYRITELQSAQLDVQPDDTEVPSLISQEQAMNEMIYGDLGVADAEMLDLDVHNDAFGFEMHGHHGEQNQGSVYLEAVQMASKRNEQAEQLILDDPSNGHAPSSSSEPSSGEQTQQPDNNEAQSACQEQTQELVADDKTAVEDKVEDQVNDVVTTGTHEESKVVYIPIQVEPLEDETNMQDKAVIIDETTAVDSTTPDNLEPIEVTEFEIEPTNIFENTAITSTFNVTEPVEILAQGITQKNEPGKIESEPEQLKPIEVEEIYSPEKTTKKDDSVKPKTPARRTRHTTSQQDTPKKVEAAEKVDEENESSKADLPETNPKAKSKLKKSDSQQTLTKMDEIEVETRPKPRTKRAKSQQPPEPIIKDVDRKKRGASEQRDFTIKIERMELMPEPSVKTTAAASEPDAEDKKRKRRGASQQKESSAQVPTEEEPSTSKVTVTKRTRNKSVTESGLGDKFDAEESVSTRRLRKATSHQSLSDAVESTIDESSTTTTKRGKSPSRKKSETTAPRRAASHQSLSSTSDSGNQGKEEPVSRSTRAKSVSMQDINNPRTRRAASQQRLDDIDEKEETKVSKRKKVKSESTDSDSELGDRFDANESAPSRRLRNAVSHQTLSKIVESAYEESPAKKGKSKIKKEPTTPRTTRRATSIQSLSSAADDEAKVVDAEVTKTRSRKRLKSDTSDQAEEKEEIGSKTPKSRSRRTSSVTEKSPKDTDSAKESRRTSKRSSKKDDDTQSEASSIVSSRSRKANTDDETSSVKSSKVRATRSGSVLPAIAEDEVQTTSTLSQDYLETSRLTRSQRATVEKYAKLKEKISAVEPTTTRRKARKAKADDTVDEKQFDFDHSDTESIVSQKSSVSKASKKSKTSEASTSQRSTRQRTQKK